MLRRLLKLSAAALLLTAIAVVVGAAFFGLQNAGERLVLDPVDAAIVLDGGVDSDGTLTPVTERRVATGVALLRNEAVTRLIMSGGTHAPTEPSPAALMRDLAVSLGAAADAVLLEENSSSTFENLRYSLRLASATGIGRLALVTDDYHLLRAKFLACYFGECGIKLVAAPALLSDDWPDVARYVGRETLAWWYNFGKVVLWSALGAAGIPDEERERYAQ